MNPCRICSRSTRGALRDEVRNHPLLAECDPAIAETLTAGLAARTEAPDGLIERSEDGGGSFLLLLEGSVRETLSEPDGRQVLIDLIRAPAVLGLEAMLADGPPRSWAAIQRSTWVEIPNDRLRAISASCPELPLRLLRTAAVQLERRQRLLYSIAFEPVKLRLARLVAGYTELFGVRTAEGLVIPIGLSYGRLSQDLGVAKRSIDRALEEWIRCGWIFKRGRNFVVRDLERILRSAEIVNGPLNDG